MRIIAAAFALIILAISSGVAAFFISSHQSIPSSDASARTAVQQQQPTIAVRSTTVTQSSHALESDLSDEQAWALAARAAYRGSADSLKELQDRAAEGVATAQYGLGHYYKFRVPRGTMLSPLLDDLEKQLAPYL